MTALKGFAAVGVAMKIKANSYNVRLRLYEFALVFILSQLPIIECGHRPLQARPYNLWARPFI